VAVAEGAVATYVECPQCHSPKAVLADDHQPWKRSYFCPNCEHEWGIPRTPIMFEEPTRLTLPAATVAFLSPSLRRGPSDRSDSLIKAAVIPQEQGNLNSASSRGVTMEKGRGA